MHALAPLIKDLAVILGIASLVVILFQKIRQPIVLGYLIAGIIIGPYTPPYQLVSDVPNIQVLAELGVIFLMFSLGLDFSFHKLKRVGFSAGVTGFVEVVLMLIIGFATGKALGWSFHNSLFLGAALSISSTTIIIKALEELHLKHRRFAELIFGVLVVEDLLAILILVALSTIVMAASIFSLSMVWAIVKLVLVVSSWFLIGYFVVPSLFRKVMAYINNETLTIISIALCLILVCAAAAFNYSVALGAFIMGSILAETPVVERIETLTKPIRDIFAAVFFVSVGMLIDPKILIEHWQIVLLITAITIVGKIVTSGLGAFLTGQSFETATRVGFSMAQIGEFSFIIAGLGLTLGVVTHSLYSIVVAVSAITTFTTPYSIKFSGFLCKQMEKHLSEKTKYFLASYSNWLYRLRADRQSRPFYRKAVLQFIVCSFVIAILFILSQRFVLPEVEKMLDLPAVIEKAVGWIVTMVVASPFIWGMLFAFKNVTTKNTQLLLVFAWIIALGEVSSLSVYYFETWIIMIVLVLVTIGFFALLYNQLEKYYQWFENRLTENLKLEGSPHVQFEELAPWDTRLVQLIVSKDSSLAGQTLQEAKIREEFGINIIAIHRDSHTSLGPRGSHKLLPQDKLILLGDDEEIERFQRIIEHVDTTKKNHFSLENFVLKTLLLEKDNPLIGRSIRDSKIREQTKGVVVGLERNGIRILNPDPATVLQKDDLLFLVREESPSSLSLQYS